MLKAYGEYFLGLVNRLKGTDYCTYPVSLLPSAYRRAPSAYFASDRFKFWVVWSDNTVDLLISSHEPIKVLSHRIFNHTDLAFDLRMLELVAEILEAAELRLCNSP